MHRNQITKTNQIIDKTGVLATFIAAFGCASCFPALGSLATSIGMGFLAQYEGILINTLLPIFASIVLIVNLVSLLNHKIWYRGLSGLLGPSMVLLTLYPLWSYGWSTYLFYAGLVLMLVVSIWDIISPPHRIK